MPRYTLLLWIFSLPIRLYTLWQTLRQGDLAFLLERLGLGRNKLKKGGIWIHAASVGEVNAVIPLIKALAASYPQQHITITTTTPTGGMSARRQLSEGMTHHYLPIDWSSAVHRFITRLQPDCALIMETELWPNLFTQCHKTNIPLIIINARLSHRTLNSKPWLLKLYAQMLENVRAVLARSEADRDSFIRLGAPPGKTQHIGNIKFAFSSADHPEPMALGRHYILAASTHDDEEIRLVKKWLSLEEHHGRILVIAPRHPKRLPSILKQLEPMDNHIAVRSRGDDISLQTQIYLADTFGELPAFIAGADFVFMGGSLAPIGGHNIMEVAQHGKAVVFGPHMDNFSDDARLFLENNAARQVNTDTELAQCLQSLMDEPQLASQMGEQGKQLMEHHSDILNRYMDEIKRLCPSLSTNA